MKILHQYESDLRNECRKTRNAVDLSHCNFLLQFTELLEHNDFLTMQSQRIRQFYNFMTHKYPYLAFTFKGRIKSLIRAEGKFNGYVIEFISDYYKEHGQVPSGAEIRQRLNMFRDLIAYRIVISLPRCNLKPGEDLETLEIKYLYDIANQLPGFLEEYGFTPEPAGVPEQRSPGLDAAVIPYYRDYVAYPKSIGYRSLHITFYDNVARCHVEIQLRTKSMDDVATIGIADHTGYEKRQRQERSRRESIPEGVSLEFDEAWTRQRKLQEIIPSELDVNMFSAVNEDLMNDGCGLYRGRLITPFEHLSKYQNDSVD